MKFGDLEIGARFTRQGSPNLVWRKQKEFKAYGQFIQNASAYASPKGPWHYEKFRDDEEVDPVNEDILYRT